MSGEFILVMTSEREALMDDKLNKVGLENLGNGAAKELFDLELQKALNNIDDINTSATATRKVTLELTIKPNKTREMADIEIKATSKLAPVKGHSGSIYVVNKGRNSVAYQSNPEQGELEFDKSKVTPMNAGKGLA